MTAAPSESVATIDVGALVARRSGEPVDAAQADAAHRIDVACRTHGFFQVVGHGIDPALRTRLRAVAEQFFALDTATKDRVAMRHGGAAWRGWFGVGDELTAGVPDDKEGYYFGTELPADDARVLAGVPLHGPNLYPSDPADVGAELRDVVPLWIDQLTAVGRSLLSGVAIAFGLDPDWFDRWCDDPTVLFRMFHYPPAPEGFEGTWGVAEHTDYGLLTLLVQDTTGGLEVRVGDRWVEVPPTEDAIVCNIGDMLERATGGRYRSTPHRVRLPATDRYSFPLFLDPGWEVRPDPIPGFTPDEASLRDGAARWDGRSVFDAEGTYGEYLVQKVSKVFPELYQQVTGPD